MAILNVSNEAQLENALLAVEGGDTIRLGAGTYDKLEISSGWRKSYDFSEKVTITSADLSNWAVIKEMSVARASNIEIKDLTLDYDGTIDSSTESWRKGTPFFIEDLREIKLDNLDFDGHLRNGFGLDRGLRMTEVDGITVSGSDFSKFHTAIDISDSSDIVIEGNAISDMSQDGIAFGTTHGIRIEDNEFFGFRSPVVGANHKDAIQVRTLKEGVSSDISIKGNDFDLSEVVQTIYVGNELVRDHGKFNEYHKNISVEDNYIRSAHIFGVAVMHADGVSIKNNTIVSNPDKGFVDFVNIPLINVSQYSKNVVVTGNQVASVPDEQNSTWSVSSNNVGPRKYTHWYGNYPSGNPVDPDDRDASFDGDILVDGSRKNGKEYFRVEGRRVDGDTSFVVKDVDFSDGDLLIFSKFDQDTFRFKAGNNQVWTWDDRRAVTVDSALDLREIAAFSPDVSATTQGEDLILRIEKGSDLVEVVLADLGDAFRDANHPELF